MNHRQHTSTLKVPVALFAACLLILAAMIVAPATTAANRPSSQTTSARPNQAVMTLYSDYQCPACRRFDSTLKAARAKYGNKLRVVLRNFPLPIHKNAMAGAYAAEAAAKQGKLWQMHDKLYANQAAWIYADSPYPVFMDFAKQLNLNVSKFAADLKSPSVASKVSTDMSLAAADGVRETPTAVFNKRAFSGTTLLRNLDQIINESLN